MQLSIHCPWLDKSEVPIIAQMGHSIRAKYNFPHGSASSCTKELRFSTMTSRAYKEFEQET